MLWMVSGIGSVLLLFFLLWILAIIPQSRECKQMHLFKGIYYAHRGLHDEAAGIPENSLPAFQRAVEEGFGIELDVHLSKDGEAVIFHDDNLKRICGVEATISDMPAEELKKMHLRDTLYTIPLLKKVLQLVLGKVPLVIELKFERDYRLLCEKVDELLKGYAGDYCIESFDPRCVWWFRRHRKEIVRGQLAECFRRHGMKMNIVLDFFLKNLLLNFLSRPDFIAYNLEDVHRACSFRLCSYLYRVQKVLWVVRSPEQAAIARKQNAVMIFEGFDPREG